MTETRRMWADAFHPQHRGAHQEDGDCTVPPRCTTIEPEAAASASDLDAVMEAVEHMVFVSHEVPFVDLTAQRGHVAAAIRAYGEQQRRQGAEDERYKVLRDFRVLAAYHAHREAEAKKEVTT